MCQIVSARYEDQECNVYIVPEKSIPEKVTEDTGLYVKNGELFLHNARVSTTPLRLAMLQFFEFLKNIGKGIILLAHNYFTFDASQLLHQLTKLRLIGGFTEIIAGFADTLLLFRESIQASRSCERFLEN